MIRHILLFTFRENVASEDIDDMLTNSYRATSQSWRQVKDAHVPDSAA